MRLSLKAFGISLMQSGEYEALRDVHCIWPQLQLSGSAQRKTNHSIIQEALGWIITVYAAFSRQNTTGCFISIHAKHGHPRTGQEPCIPRHPQLIDDAGKRMNMETSPSMY
jgi:hypothetical protein